MIYQNKTSLACLVVITVASLVASPVAAYAGTFKRTRVMDLKYAWGTTSKTEFDAYDMMYPGYFPIAEITFETDGSFTAYDTASGSTGDGVYDKRGRNLEITIINPQYNSIVQYVGSKESRGVFSGEILVNGNVAGHWRGEF
jgi:hypothetical protein